VPEPESGSPADLGLWAARGRRRAETRRKRSLGRLRRRRRVYRLLVSLLGATVVALAIVAGPQSAGGLQAPRPGIAKSSLVCPVPADLRPAFVAAARRAHVQLSLLAAVAQVESRFDQGARSEAGAVGVLQLLPSTAAELKLDPSRSRTNILAGALYLKQMLDRYRSPSLALAAYNAGPAAVDRVAGPPSFETAAYAANVQVWWRAYEGCT
jgi:soluble lytic murein transglycosylase-like protein